MAHSPTALSWTPISAGIDAPTIDYIVGKLESSTTTIKLGQTSAGPIKLGKGVKQGDPLSPILFNLVINDLLVQLNTQRSAATIKSRTTSVPEA